jgi:hypothetical protein
MVLTTFLTGFLYFVYYLELKVTRKYMFRKMNLIPSSGYRQETTTLLGNLRRPNLNDWG